MVQEQRGGIHRCGPPSNRPKIGCVPPDPERVGQRAEVDAGTREGVTTAEAQQVKELEREVKELRRANGY